METDLFDYHLPASSIAQEPIEPRDRARLLRCRGLEDRLFCDLPEILSAGDLLVVNLTRVRAARLRGRKQETGGSVELLLLRRVDESRWEALVRPARRIRPGTIIECGEIVAEILTEPNRGEAVVALAAGRGDVEAAIAAVGEIPLPPYFHGELPDPERYQTVFARSVGSAAAPTAALHFTPELLDRLQEVGVSIAEVDLEVGLDTFRPIGTGSISDHAMHSEAWEVPEEAARAVAETRKNGGRIVAVGTTVVRTLESAAVTGAVVQAGRGDTDLFISPGYELKVVDAVLTNFHAPRTTLIVMMAAILGEQWRDVYDYALRSGYRFLSFGDSMLIEDPKRGSR
ncbi:MAG: tRNA preQ1(34) S-adenosylmethionine ribosyltransferase-isomerase QueA [Acidimicrobiia bacterium]|nr:tRNA preQ1(34) S-adenosylmethionine ribosyltransferase-isomerase QueA [Acidimicrobiia bacterium]